MDYDSNSSSVHRQDRPPRRQFEQRGLAVARHFGAKERPLLYGEESAATLANCCHAGPSTTLPTVRAVKFGGKSGQRAQKSHPDGNAVE
jgi:hypothetical protein